MSIMVAIGEGADAGVLIKSAESLERMEKVDALVVDKTGTLTITSETFYAPGAAAVPGHPILSAITAPDRHQPRNPAPHLSVLGRR